MPRFAVQNVVYEISQTNLDKAPQSLLTEAWDAKTDGAVVELAAWPAPNGLVFQVCRVRG